MSTVNLKLLPLKLLLFFLYGAFGCVAPYLTLHMFSIGLSHEEVTWINTALPVAALAGPPIAGYFADRFGHYKLITISSMLLAAIFHTSLLFVPAKIATTADSFPVNLICGPQGSTLSFPACTTGCSEIGDVLSSRISLSDCRTECPFTETPCSTFMKPEPRTADKQVAAEVTIRKQPPPTLCYGHPDTRNCRTSESLDIKTAFGTTEGLRSDGGSCCTYELHYPESEAFGSRLMCPTTADNCQVICRVHIEVNETIAFDNSQCNLSRDDTNHTTFWVYFLLRVVADIFPAILISLLDAVALTMISQHGGDFGRQKLLGLLAIGTSAPIVGYLMDAQVGVYGKYVYSPVFYVFDLLMVITALLTLMLPIKVEIQRSSMLANFGQLIRTLELNLLFVVVVSLGMMWAFLETFLYVHLKDLGASNLLLGLTITVGILPSIPFLYKSEAVVKICGHHYLLILAFISYSLRFTGLSFLTNPWWVMPLETLELFSLNLVLVASATLAFRLAPKRLVCTAQGLVWMAHFNVGRCVGTFLGGYLMKVYGIVWVFKAASVFSALFAGVYLLLHTLFKRRKHQQNKAIANQQPITNGDVPNGNGHYMPLATDSQKAV